MLSYTGFNLSNEYWSTILLESPDYYFNKQASRKRISELSLGNSHSVKRRKCHWDFVLEEMAWLSNDFMQVCPSHHSF